MAKTLSVHHYYLLESPVMFYFNADARTIFGWPFFFGVGGGREERWLKSFSAGSIIAEVNAAVVHCCEIEMTR